MDTTEAQHFRRIVKGLGHTYVCSQSFSRVLLFATLLGCSPQGSSVLGIFQARILPWVAHSLLWGIFPNQGSNSGLLHWQADSLQLSHLGSPNHTHTYIHSAPNFLPSRLQHRVLDTVLSPLNLMTLDQFLDFLKSHSPPL